MAKKYFKTGNASRTFKTKDHAFRFERLIFDNGAWLGVYETEDEAEAKVLASYGPPIHEINESEYSELKKKPNLSYVQSEEEATSEEEEPEQEENAPTAPVEDLEEELDFRKSPGDEPETKAFDDIPQA